MDDNRSDDSDEPEEESEDSGGSMLDESTETPPAVTAEGEGDANPSEEQAAASEDQPDQAPQTEPTAAVSDSAVSDSADSAQQASAPTANAPRRIFGTEEDDTLHGTTKGDLLAGNEGDDHLIGHAGNDNLIGFDQGQDTLAGNAGNDTLRGFMVQKQPDHLSYVIEDHQSDQLAGGLGNDVLFLGSDDLGAGGQGADGFHVSWDVEHGHPAQITDYNPKVDRIFVDFTTNHADEGMTDITQAEKSITTEPMANGAGTAILIDGEAIAHVLGAKHLTAADIGLIRH